MLDMDELRRRRQKTIERTFRFLGVDDGFHSPAFESRLNTRRDKQAMTESRRAPLGSSAGARRTHPAGRHPPEGRALHSSVAVTERQDARPAGKHRLRSEGAAPAGGGAAASSNRHGVCNVVDVNAIQRASFREGFGFAAMSAAAGGVVGIVSSILIARLYGIEVIGQYALATAPMGIVWFFSTVRERPGLIRALNPLQPRSPRSPGSSPPSLHSRLCSPRWCQLSAPASPTLLFNGPIDQPELFAPAVVCLGGYLIVVNTGWNIDGALSAFRAGRQLFWIRLHQAVAFMPSPPQQA